MEALLKRVNDGIYSVERWIAVVVSVVMAVVVFFDVVYRRYAAIDSKIIEKLGRWTGMDREGSFYLSLQDSSTIIVWALAFGLVYFGIRSASRRPLFEDVPKADAEEPIDVRTSLVVSLLILSACWLILRIFFGTGIPETILACPEAYTWDCGIWPNGVTWAQPLALVFTLWLGFLGASMATRDHRHLKVEALQRFMPEKVQRALGLVSSLAAAGFCLLLAYLAWRYVGYMHDDYVDSDGLGGLHDGIDLPRYQAFLVVPFSYMLMAVRFVATGILAARGELETGPTELADIDFGDVEGAEREVVAPSDKSDDVTVDDSTRSERADDERPATEGSARGEEVPS